MFSRVNLTLPGRAFGLLYLLTILCYSIAYSALAPEIVGCDLGYLDALYFSAVTITTLGYGDISLTTEFGRLLSASEAVLGIMLIGLFLNSLATEWSTKIARTEKETAEHEYQKLQIARLIGRFALADRYYWRFMYLTDCLTLPFDDRSAGTTETELIERLKGDLAFSAMRDLFLPTFLQTDPPEITTVRAYLEVQGAIEKELENIVRDVDLQAAGQMREIIIEYLKRNAEVDFTDALLDASHRYEMNNDDELVKLVVRTISKSHGQPEFQPSNIINAYVWLFRVVRGRAIILHALRLAVSELDPKSKFVEYSRMGDVISKPTDQSG